MAISENPAVIVESITIEAPIAAVYAALTDPAQLMQWWGSDDTYRITAAQGDVRPGGAWKTSGVGADGTPFAAHGVYRTIDAPRLVEFTWSYDWSAGAHTPETVVRYELFERDGRTNLTVIHSGFTSVEDREGHTTGWKRVLDWLREFVTKSA